MCTSCYLGQGFSYLKKFSMPNGNGSSMDSHRIYDLTVIYLFKCIFNLGDRAVTMLQARATLIRHWVMQWSYFTNDAVGWTRAVKWWSSLKFMNLGDKPNLLKLVLYYSRRLSISWVRKDLFWPKIVRVLKRLGNTDINTFTWLKLGQIWSGPNHCFNLPIATVMWLQMKKVFSYWSGIAATRNVQYIFKKTQLVNVHKQICTDASASQRPAFFRLQNKTQQYSSNVKSMMQWNNLSNVIAIGSPSDG